MHSYANPGAYIIKFGVKEVGLSDFRATKTMNVNVVAAESNNLPPAVSIPLSGSSTVALGASNSWSVTANDPNGDALSYRFYWGDGNESLFSATSGVSVVASHTYSTAGNYTLYVTIGDSLGGGTLVSVPVVVGVVAL